VRRAEEADIVIANHALVMLLAERRQEEGRALGRIVFDEGHHLHDAADSTFSAALTGQEAIELRRWIVGPELATADAYATAAFAMGEAGPQWTAGLGLYEAMTILADGRVLLTPGFPSVKT